MAEVNGAATKGLYPYIKHFALNDQEGNRCSFLLTFASEQAIREIYLKPFELATKGYTGTCRAVMSSFNWIGTEPSCANAHLLKNVLHAVRDSFCRPTILRRRSRPTSRRNPASPTPSFPQQLRQCGWRKTTSRGRRLRLPRPRRPRRSRRYQTRSCQNP